MAALRPLPLLLLLLLLLLAPSRYRYCRALDNGLRVPPMGWSSWYGFKTGISETLVKDIGDGMKTSGLSAVGYDQVWLDDGWALPRDASSHKIVADPKLFPSGMKSLVAHLHSIGLKFGIYTSKGNLTCLGSLKGQPKRPGSYGYEAIDADMFAREWGVDGVKDDGCGDTPGHNPWTAMRDALNRTGKPVFYAIHAGNCENWTDYNCVNGSIANMWRTGGDLVGSDYGVWTNRLDLATLPEQAAMVGPGSFANPDYLQVGYSPRTHKGGGGAHPGSKTMDILEQRSMFTMWACLPGPLILGADLRSSAFNTGAGLDDDVLLILNNTEVIGVNQDPAAQPMRPVRRAGGMEVWKKPLSAGNGSAVVFFHRNDTGYIIEDHHATPAAAAEAAAAAERAAAVEHGHPAKMVNVSWEELGLAVGDKVTVRDLWAKETLGVYAGWFNASVAWHEAKIFTFKIKGPE